MTIVDVFGLALNAPIDWAFARYESATGESPIPVRSAALYSVVAGSMVVWCGSTWQRQSLAAGIFWGAYYLFGDHGRRWGRKAKQWASAQLMAVQAAAWRRETAEAR